MLIYVDPPKNRTRPLGWGQKTDGVAPQQHRSHAQRKTAPHGSSRDLYHGAATRISTRLRHLQPVSEHPSKHAPAKVSASLDTKETRESQAPKQIEEATGGAQVYCCGNSAIDELANSGQAGKTQDGAHDFKGWVDVPTGAADIGLAAGVAYASFAGVILALFQIKPHYQNVVREICTTWENAEKQLKALDSGVRSDPFLPATYEEAKSALKAKIKYCQSQLTEAFFQMHVAGDLSALASLLTVIGQFIPPVQIMGLGLHSVLGMASAVNAVRNLVNNQRDANKRAQDLLHFIGQHRGTAGQLTGQERAFLTKKIKECDWDSVEKQLANVTDDQLLVLRASGQAFHFYHKRHATLLKNLASWTCYSAGSALITVGMLGMLGIIGATIPLVIPLLGLGLLLPGIAGTLVYNNRLSGNQYYPGMPPKLQFKTPSRGEVVICLDKARNLENLSKAYRREIFKTSIAQKVRRIADRWLSYKIWNYLSFGLAAEALMPQKFKVKARFVAGIPLDCAVFHRYLNEFDALSSSQIAAKPSVPFSKDGVGDLNACLDKLSRSEDNHALADSCGKLLARKLLGRQVMRTWSLKPFAKPEQPTHPSGIVKSAIHEKTYLGLVHMRRVETLKVNAPYRELFAKFKTGGKIETESDLNFILWNLYRAKPCCIWSNESAQLFSYLKDLYKNGAPQLAGKLGGLLENTFKQYLIFQAKKDARRETALWTSYLDGFDAPALS